ncbi:hypothetical protein PILCRDRAFT_255956 [Piloderma croceum F 1598]|uniref:DUF6533 domain-containing protein n=1 Tax=Piloderma croceum (strain F 1598) TaxID=765440 RepID=A0A0C3FVD3_PILCF|nr:hypothetical protein PILCRDRAFT_255956 [Piloderma croceum F 1598]
MASNSTIPPDAILNPYTPLAFMPPDVAEQYQVVCYVYVATFAAYAWDWLMSIPEEYAAVRKVGFKAPNIAYFLSRFGTFGSVLSTTIRIAPIDNCNALKYVEGVFAEIAIPSTSLLFFFRVRAIYNNSRVVTAVFGFIWIALAGLSILVMLGITKDRIPYTRLCTAGLAHPTTAIPIILSAANDTLIFFAISYRMLSLSMVGGTWSARAKSFFTGKGLHQLSRSVLQSGQAYYFVTIGVAIASTALMASPSIPGTMKPILGSTYFAVASAMACRVYRAILLGHITEPQVNNTRISSVFRVATNNNNHHRHHLHSHAHDDHKDGEDCSDSSIIPGPGRPRLSPDLKINVAVEKSTRVESDVGYTFWERSSIGDYIPGYDASRRV